jgi:hypothetical protein
MSAFAWYHHKAEQCARMAKAATDPRMRAEYEERQGLWLEIADGVEPETQDPFASRHKLM